MCGHVTSKKYKKGRFFRIARRTIDRLAIASFFLSAVYGQSANLALAVTALLSLAIVLRIWTPAPRPRRRDH